MAPLKVKLAFAAVLGVAMLISALDAAVTTTPAPSEESAANGTDSGTPPVETTPPPVDVKLVGSGILTGDEPAGQPGVQGVNGLMPPKQDKPER